MEGADSVHEALIQVLEVDKVKLSGVQPRSSQKPSTGTSTKKKNDKVSKKEEKHQKMTVENLPLQGTHYEIRVWRIGRTVLTAGRASTTNSGHHRSKSLASAPRRSGTRSPPQIRCSLNDLKTPSPQEVFRFVFLGTDRSRSFIKSAGEA